MKLLCQLESRWPPLAWLASVTRNGSEVTLRHGSGVDTGEDWFAEAVWNGPFEQLDFDKTDIFFGSAGKFTKPNSFVFVSSSSPLDRLCYLYRTNEILVSNSLVCLIAATEATLDPFYKNYPGDFKSIILGPDSCRPTLETTAGEIHLVYVDNLVCDQGFLERAKKPTPKRERDSFASYQTFLETELCLIAKNMKSDQRKRRFGFLGTASTGFDSPTICAIAKKAGLNEVICMDSSRGGQSDSGANIARQLGLEPHVYSRNAWQESGLVEIPFLAADAKGEDVYFSTAASKFRGKVLLTGYCGNAWGSGSQRYFDFRRTDQSGLSLTEYRLWEGFIHVPVPTLGVYRAEDLPKLMASAERKKWSSGGKYDKPFCRFVLDNAGVSGDLYGVEKKAASVLIHDRRSFLTTKSKADFKIYIREKKRSAPITGIRLHGEAALSRVSRFVVKLAINVSAALFRTTSLNLFRRVSQSVRLNEYADGEPWFRFLFPWAIEHARQRYLNRQDPAARAAGKALSDDISENIHSHK